MYASPYRYHCDCCGYKTLSNKGEFDLCFLCKWEDDDSYSWDKPDEVVGGANGDYSLREANLNFKKFYTMYRVVDRDRYFEIFKEVIEAKQKVTTLLGIFEVLVEKDFPRMSELTQLNFAVRALRQAEMYNPYMVYATGKIEKKPL